jgi:predicted amidophosphoribosyltransferase
LPAVDFDRLDPQPAGFGRCGQCAYRDVGSAGVCFACASRGLALVAGAAGHCQTCDQRLPASGRCSNLWCNRPQSVRFFDFIYAIAMRTGELENAINRYKYHGANGWAAIFGRVLVGFLDEVPGVADGWDAIIASPTYLGPGARRSRDHIRTILEQAALEAGDRWPIHTDPPLIVKTRETPKLVGMRLGERRQACETELRQALSVPDPAAVADRRLLVFDDVFTDGSTLREVARALLGAGAAQVGGIVLARQPWQSQ